MRNHPKRICLQCGKTYSGWGLKFCSNKCSDLFNKEHYVPKRKKVICKQCNKEFYSEYKYKKRIFCSVNCRAENVRKNGSPKRIYPQKGNNSSLKTKYSNISRRSKSNGWECISSKAFVDWYSKQNQSCFYCGIPLEIWELLYSGSQWKFSLTIDRKDNNVGYVEDNMVLACGNCNVIKNNILTCDEMKEIGEKYLKSKWQNKLREVKNNELVLG